MPSSKPPYMKVRKAKDLFPIFSNPEILFLCTYDQICLLTTVEHKKRTMDVATAKAALRQPNIEGTSPKPAKVNSKS